MHPEICRIGPLVIYSYGFALVVAFFVVTTLASIEAKRRGTNPDIIYNLIFIAFITGVIGARILYVFQNLNYYIKSPLEIVMLQRGGLSWFGGLFLGITSSIIYLKIKKLEIYKVADIVVPYLALGQAIGRFGCFFNGCCYGRESVYGIYFPVHDKILIPTQLYSALISLIIFIILRWILDNPHRQGQILFTYLLLYSIKRFFIEFFRADNPQILFSLTLFQIMSIAVFMLAAIKLGLIFLKEKDQ